MGYSVVAGAAGRLLFGYDSFGNVCGKRNSPVEGAPLSGQDMTLKKHVFFMNACNLEVKDRGRGPMALCVSSCPEKQLDTLEEVQLFANINGSFLCVYSLNSFNYTQSPSADRLCPRLPVPPRKLRKKLKKTHEQVWGDGSVEKGLLHKHLKVSLNLKNPCPAGCRRASICNPSASVGEMGSRGRRIPEAYGQPAW